MATSNVTIIREQDGYRANLMITNNTSSSIPLDFSEISTLTSPIKAKSMSVVKFAIPSAGVPLIRWTSNTQYAISIRAYEGGTGSTYVSTQYVILDDMYGDGNVHNLHQLCSMFNNAIFFALSDLSQTINLSTAQAYFKFDTLNSLFTITFNSSWLGNPNGYSLTLIVNSNMYYTFLDTMYTSLDALGFRFISTGAHGTFDVFNNTTGEGTFIQESTMVGNFASLAQIYITTQLPITPEALLTTPRQILSTIPDPSHPSQTITISRSTSATTDKILRSFIVPYSNGVKDIKDYITFSANSDPYYSTSVYLTDQYNLQCQFKYILRDLTVGNFLLPPNQYAFLQLEFKE